MLESVNKHRQTINSEIAMNKYPIIHKNGGPLVSTKNWSAQDKQDTEVFYHHKEKAECAMVASSSWYGGDIMEFGSHDLCTGRNLLTAIDISGMAKAYADTRFYFFDAFGKFPSDMGELGLYFKPYSDQGDQIQRHAAYLYEHGLFVDRCYLVQGLFQDTCTQDFKEKWQNDKPVVEDHSQTALHLPPEHRNPVKRQIGFASIDCNVPSSYKTVFEFIFDMLAENSYVYLDEGLQSADVLEMWDQFIAALERKRNMKAVYIRNAGGFGSLWRLYPVIKAELNL